MAINGRGKQHVLGLDGIRALAVSLVLFSHSVIYDQFNSLRPVGLVAGYAGVSMFFVLSGYLITALLVREEDRTGRISLRLFYLRRSFRLFPALWLYLSVVFVIWLAGGLPDHPWHGFLTSLFYVRNLVGHGHETGHLWSLSIEEQFYVLWPLAMICMGQRNRLRLAFGVSVLLAVTAWRLIAARHHLATEGALYIRSDFRFDAPLFGCCLALAARVAPDRVMTINATPRRSGALALATTAGLAAWVAFRIDNAVLPGLGSTIVCVLSAGLILSQVGARGVGSDWLSWRPLVLLGQISYGVYLWQELFLGPLVSGFHFVRSFPLGLLATFAVAVTSYVCMERPLIALKDRRFQPILAAGLGHVNGELDIVKATPFKLADHVERPADPAGDLGLKLKGSVPSSSDQ